MKAILSVALALAAAGGGYAVFSQGEAPVSKASCCGADHGVTATEVSAGPMASAIDAKSGACSADASACADAVCDTVCDPVACEPTGCDGSAVVGAEGGVLAMPMDAAACSAKAECSEAKAECSEAKAECSEAKAECSEAKAECSEAKSACEAKPGIN